MSSTTESLALPFDNAPRILCRKEILARGSRAAREIPSLALSGLPRHAGHAMALTDLARKTSVHVVSAVLVMGSWAAFANRNHGAAALLRAACVQAGASAFFTFTLMSTLERLGARLRGTKAYIVPPSVCCVIVLAILVTAHRLAGTPQLWATIAVPYAASAGYAWVYGWNVASHRGDTKAR